MLQELKGEVFPHLEFEALGYQVLYKGQKAYNGVATLTHLPAKLISDVLPGDPSDQQARFLDIELDGLRLINIYLPNGNPKETDKFTYKLSFMDRLHDYIANLRQSRTAFILAGDFNVIPEALDALTPSAWLDDALFSTQAREKFRALCALGLTDSVRALNPLTPELFTFWDYQAAAFERNHGIRIDHILLSPTIADRLSNTIIDKNPRGWDTPSDHTPVIAEINLTSK